MIRSILLAVATTATAACSGGDHMLGMSPTSEGLGETRWAIATGGHSQIVAGGVAVESTGDVVATGMFSGTADFGSGALATKGQLGTFITARAGATGDELWTRVVQLNPGDVNLAVPALALDANDGAFIAGAYRNAQPGQLLDGTLPAAATGALYLASLDASGTLRWSTTLPGVFQFQNAHLVARAGGGVILSADFAGTITLPDGTTLTNQEDPATPFDTDVMILAFDGSGALVWSAGFHGPGAQGQTGIAVAADGDVIVTGHVEEHATFAGFTPLAPVASNNQWLARLAADTGKARWQVVVGDPAVPVVAGAVAIGPEDAAIVGATTDGPTGLKTSQFPQLAQIDASGAAMWSSQANQAVAGGAFGASLAARPDGSVVSAGTIYNGLVDLGSGPINGGTYVAAFDPSGETGELPVTRAFCNAQTCTLGAVAADPHSGAIAIAGVLADVPADLGTGALAPQGDDLLLAVIDEQ